MSTQVDVTTLRALLEKATPGPWQTRFMHRVFQSARKDTGLLFNSTSEQDWKDCELIAELVNAAPALLDAVDAAHVSSSSSGRGTGGEADPYHCNVAREACSDSRCVDHYGRGAATQGPAEQRGITHCDNCGLDWLDNGLNPIGCPYCKQAPRCTVCGVKWPCCAHPEGDPTPDPADAEAGRREAPTQNEADELMEDLLGFLGYVRCEFASDFKEAQGAGGVVPAGEANEADMSTRVDVTALRALLEKATKGPWTLDIETEGDEPEDGLTIVIPEISRALHDHDWAESSDWKRDKANAELIVAAINALPILLDAVDAAPVSSSSSGRGTGGEALTDDVIQAAIDAYNAEMSRSYAHDSEAVAGLIGDPGYREFRARYDMRAVLLSALARPSGAPKSGPDAMLDQTDADNYHLARENRRLRERLVLEIDEACTVAAELRAEADRTVAEFSTESQPFSGRLRAWADRLEQSRR